MSEVSLRKSHRCYVATTSRKVSNHWMFDLFASHGHRTNPYFAVKSSCTCQLFSEKCVRFGLHRTWNSEDLPRASEDCRSFRKNSEDFLWTSKNNRRSRKIFDDFKTGRLQFSKDFQPIPSNIKEFRRCSDDFSNVFNQLHSTPVQINWDSFNIIGTNWC